MLLLRYLKTSFWFLFGAIWALVGTPFLVAGVAWGLAQQRLQERGVRTDARVVEKYTRRDSDGDLHYLLRLSYTDRGSGRHDLEEGVSPGAFESVGEGSDVLVVYDPENPSRASLAGEHADSRWVGPLVFAGLGAAFAGVGWALVLREIRRSLSRIRLLRQGMAVRGQVMELRQDLSVRVNRRHPAYLIYAFPGPDARRREGRSPLLSRRDEERFVPGSPIAVIYDPLNPDRHEADIFGARSAELGLEPT